jgi:hypothetical protein
LFNKLNFGKSCSYIREYGIKTFFKRSKEKLLDNIKTTMDSSASKGHPAVNFIRQKIAPLNLEIVRGEKDRVNILISIIDFQYFFGGYLGMFNLAKSISRAGLNVRMIIVDKCRYEPGIWKKEIRKYGGLEDFFDIVEVINACSRMEAIRVNKNDVFLATSWWTAHIANYARKYLNSERFLYFIQEYEPFFYPMGTLSALSSESYNFQHYALFSTQILQEYFRQKKIGVFRDGSRNGDVSSVAIENAVLKFNIDKSNIAGRTKKKFLFYARPEEHAARNMFEIGMIALSNTIMGGHFDKDTWEFFGIGSVDWGNHRITLYRNTFIQLLPKMSLKEYKELLPGFDIGLSLMMSPHPSLPPLEMAAAGLLTVTNTYANKTEKALKEISSNIIPAAPTVEGVEKALQTALDKCEDYDLRIKGSHINWSQSWEDTFNDEVLKKIKGFIENIKNS